MISIFTKLKEALSNTSNKISSKIDHLFFKKKLDQEALDELEEILISSDISVAVAGQIINDLKILKFNKDVDSEEIKEELSSIINKLFLKENTLILKENGLNIILVCGVNGNGKTTTIGKLAGLYMRAGKKIAIAACDTYRAAAIEQVGYWAKKTNSLLIQGETGADPASVAYNAILKASNENYDILFIDTAGRLHNHKNLMDELSKILRIIKKFDPLAPAHTLLVIDATTGQNAYNQVEEFKKAASISGLIITKLDGTAKAGVIIGITQKHSLPIHFIGIGESIEDLKPFEAKLFSRAIVGLN